MFCRSMALRSWRPKCLKRGAAGAARVDASARRSEAAVRTALDDTRSIKRLHQHGEELWCRPARGTFEESGPSRAGESARSKVAPETDGGDREADIGYALQALRQGDCRFAGESPTPASLENRVRPLIAVGLALSANSLWVTKVTHGRRE
jgi:hypothetical protein